MRYLRLLILITLATQLTACTRERSEYYRLPPDALAIFSTIATDSVALQNADTTSYFRQDAEIMTDIEDHQKFGRGNRYDRASLFASNIHYRQVDSATYHANAGFQINFILDARQGAPQLLISADFYKERLPLPYPANANSRPVYTHITTNLQQCLKKHTLSNGETLNALICPPNIADSSGLKIESLIITERYGLVEFKGQVHDTSFAQPILFDFKRRF